MECKKTTLAIVCCHAIFEGSDRTDENNWRLQSFQRSSGLKPGEHLTFLRHIDAAVELLKSKSVGSVIFSGGRTNPDVADLSEAQSYLNALKCTRRDALDGILLEERATDSYQNLLFSILLFRQIYGHYPSQICIVTHAFKRDRFLDLHAKAIRWPVNRIQFLGINPPFSRKYSIFILLFINPQIQPEPRLLLFTLPGLLCHPTTISERIAQFFVSFPCL